MGALQGIRRLCFDLKDPRKHLRFTLELVAPSPVVNTDVAVLGAETLVLPGTPGFGWLGTYLTNWRDCSVKTLCSSNGLNFKQINNHCIIIMTMFSLKTICEALQNYRVGYFLPLRNRNLEGSSLLTPLTAMLLWSKDCAFSIGKLLALLGDQAPCNPGWPQTCCIVEGRF